MDDKHIQNSIDIGKIKAEVEGIRRDIINVRLHIEEWQKRQDYIIEDNKKDIDALCQKLNNVINTLSEIDSKQHQITSRLDILEYNKEITYNNINNLDVELKNIRKKLTAIAERTTALDNSIKLFEEERSEEGERRENNRNNFSNFVYVLLAGLFGFIGVQIWELIIFLYNK